MSAKAKALETPAFVHPTAIVDDGVLIGAGTHVWAFSHLMRGAVVGASCVIGERVHVGIDVSIGDRCKIQNGVNLFRGVRLEDLVFLGSNVQTTNEKHIGLTDREGRVRTEWELGYTIFRKGCAVGSNVVIVCGSKSSPLELGRFCIVGAGAVVTKSVPEGAIVYGNPARIVGYRKK